MDGPVIAVSPTSKRPSLVVVCEVETHNEIILALDQASGGSCLTKYWENNHSQDLLSLGEVYIKYIVIQKTVDSDLELMDLSKVRLRPEGPQWKPNLWFTNKDNLRKRLTHPQWGL